MLPSRDRPLEERDAYRRALREALSLADDCGFLTLVWAIDALQGGRSAHALRHLAGVPATAITEEFTDPSAIRGWELETLCNELLCVPKHPHYRLFDTRPWDHAVAVVSLLRDLENAESRA